MKPKISVCIPAYQAPAFFGKVLESVLQQEFRDFEVIVTDDSPDDSIRDIVSQVQCTVPLVYEKNHQRLGAPRNWNRCISLATGEYVKMLHHDDWFLTPDSLGQFLRLMESNPDACMGFSSSQTYEERTVLKSVHRPSAKVEWLKKDPNVLFLENFVGPPSSVIFRNGLGVRFDESLRWLVDVEFYLRLLRDKPFAFCEEPLVGVTVEGAHQVTREFECKNEREIFEYLYVYGKMPDRSRRIFAYLGVFARLFNKFSVKSTGDLSRIAPEISIPWYLKVLAAMPR